MLLKQKSTRLSGVVFLCLSALIFTLPAGDVLAKHRGGRVIVSPRVHHPGRFVRKLPRGHIRIRHRGARYFFHGGVFYRPALPGYVVVRPPIGALVATLPVGFTIAWIAGLKYYCYGGAFYRSAPRGYVVVEAPADVVVAEEPLPVAEPTEKATGKVSVNTATLNVRAGPDLEYAVIHQVGKGDALEVHGREEGWLYVKLPNDEFGWVMAEFTIQIEPPPSG
jgi:hypothetical protein